MMQSLLLFVLAGLCEIGGGYLFWLWLREGKSIWLAILGLLALCLYAVLPTLQTANFGRVYAAYGGVFIVLSIAWGWLVDRVVPDKFDLIGAWIAFLGVLVIMYAPRH
ncbi:MULTISPECIES: YnfA family protein [Pseudanabaena]|jgi:small multidrug resistance family-3 protein|uniref:YnfA family protein n=1 Tax=Pseudanabaena TaxID=1152 RepID=UPI00247972A4|nr:MULTISPECIES: YnfA family protein [Pseudanabaena]MEA5487590.1 YnfA family protein [Pseudanabaena sp. CCNP1317]WGS75359.1 YnfA family protein [Pseudanabaena galeata CCNP1313]